MSDGNGSKRPRPGSDGDESSGDANQALIEAIQGLTKSMQSLESSFVKLNNKFDVQEQKLDKVSKDVESQSATVANIRSELDILRQDHHTDNLETKQELRKQQQVFQDTSNKLTELTQEVESLKNYKNIIRAKLIDAEARSRRNNLLFFGIEESQNESAEEKIMTFLKDKLQVNTTPSIERAHRLGRPPSGPQIGNKMNRPRPIIVKFSLFQQREAIRRERFKLNSPFGIAEDLPREIREARKSVTGLVRDIKNQGHRVAVVYPCKVIKNGEVIKDVDVTKFFNE